MLGWPDWRKQWKTLPGTEWKLDKKAVAHPIVLYCDMAVDPAQEQKMLDHYHNDFKPVAEKFEGYIDLKIVKLRRVMQGGPPPPEGVNYRFQLTDKSELKRRDRNGLCPRCIKEKLAADREYAPQQKRLPRAAHGCSVSILGRRTCRKDRLLIQSATTSRFSALVGSIVLLGCAIAVHSQAEARVRAGRC